MIRKLRIKFICVIMAIVAVVVGAVLGVLIHFAAQSMELQSTHMMYSLVTAPGQPDRPGNLFEYMRQPYFTVQIGRNGELLSANGGAFALSDKEYIQELTRAAMDSDKENGRLREYNLRYLKHKEPFGHTIVFVDTTSETTTLRNLVNSSILIFLGAMALFLCISILLSHWVIKPVATAWDQQRQFVADASHELKTPLSVIMANAELLQNDNASEEERERFSKSILTMSYQMRSLVENMLEMARVDNGAAKVHFGAVDFTQLVSDAVLSFQLLYEERNMDLTSNIQEGVTLQGSEQHLYQVMDVLLDNALKYSTPQGTVAVSLEQSGRNCVLSVSGPGAAISKEDLKNIFKRFYRVDKARAMNGSYGLGLSIAESIVAAHKGKIWAKSEDGCNTFFVQLPVS